MDLLKELKFMKYISGVSVTMLVSIFIVLSITGKLIGLPILNIIAALSLPIGMLILVIDNKNAELQIFSGEVIHESYRSPKTTTYSIKDSQGSIKRFNISPWDYNDQITIGDYISVSYKTGKLFKTLTIVNVRKNSV